MCEPGPQDEPCMRPNRSKIKLSQTTKHDFSKFLKDPLTQLLSPNPRRVDPDGAAAGSPAAEAFEPGALVLGEPTRVNLDPLDRLIERASQSGLSRIASHPAYRRMTIRNWNTTTKLLAMMDEG